MIGIVGEAGVGKSRLCHEFAERRRARGVPVYQVAGQAHGKSVPLLPVLQFLRTYFGITERDSDRAARERIAGRLLLLDKRFEDDLPLIFDFLAVPDPERPAPRMDPEARQRQLLGMMKRLTHAESAHEPGVVVFEDLHWLDPASEVFLANRIEAVQGTRSLTVLNFRPEYRAAVDVEVLLPPDRARSARPRGDRADARSSCSAPIPRWTGCPSWFASGPQGNPFFIEELVQALVEAGSLEGERGAYRLAGPVEEVAVPASVQAVLGARIDRLERREKAVLQAAAVIGKEFPAPVLERVVELEPAELEEALRSLVAGEFVYEQEIYPEALYAFKHPLTQEVSYGSQLGERRATVHAAVAQAIAEHYPERLDEHAALLAQHCEAAGETLEAARWHARAATWSGTTDPTQALRHWHQVRELTDALPESEEAGALGLTARLSWLNYGWRLGISHEEAEAVFNEAEQLALRAGDIGARAILLSSYGAVRGLGDGDLHGYAQHARQAFALAEESGDPALYMAIAVSAYALYCIGEHREAVTTLDRAIELADGDVTVGAGSNLGCPYAFCLGIKGLNLVNLGELEEARRLLEQARKLAREQGDIETVGFCHTLSAWHAYFQGDPETALGHAQEAIQIAERTGSAYSRAWSWFWLGLAERMRGEWQRAIEALERSAAIARERRTAVEGDAYASRCSASHTSASATWSGRAPWSRRGSRSPVPIGILPLSHM